MSARSQQIALVAAAGLTNAVGRSGADLEFARTVYESASASLGNSSGAEKDRMSAQEVSTLTSEFNGPKVIRAAKQIKATDGVSTNPAGKSGADLERDCLALEGADIPGYAAMDGARLTQRRQIGS